MKVGIMGGTFDPVHIGHLIAAEFAREAAGLDEVWFIPVNVPPHKHNLPAASGAQRMQMLRLAIAEQPLFRVVEDELVRGGISFSVDTLAKLRHDHPHVQFQYIIGADMVMYLPKWHRIEEIILYAGFIGLQRPGFVVDMAQLPIAIRQKVNLVSLVQIDISSTEIRQRIRQKQSVRYLVSDQVLTYLKENHMYES